MALLRCGDALATIAGGMKTISPVLRLSRPIYELMLWYVSAEMPNEACGLLAGRDGHANHLYLIENRLHSPTAFEMSPRQQIHAMLDIEAQGLALLAAFHSHPTGPSRPSSTDVAQAYYPDVAQIILSLQQPAQPRLGVYKINDGQVQALDWQFV